MSASISMSVLCMLPALALVIPLLLRRYPGERALAALRKSGRRPSKAPVTLVAHARPSLRLAPRGSLLLARSLAVRPPPALAFALSAS